tara:strand:+ start:12632 stop:12826 length:195 start_codon:yes stop_codon:yes gene_type:complete
VSEETVNSRRIRIINYQTSDIHTDISNLNESLVDKDRVDCLELIEMIRTRLNILKEQIVNGEII